MIAHMAQGLSWELIGERIRLSRLSKGLSQGALARRVGLERSMVSKLESGGRHVDAVELTRIAQAVELPLTHFLSEPPAVVSRRTATASEINESDDSKKKYRTEALLSDWLRDVGQLMDDGVLGPRELQRFDGVVNDCGGAREAAGWLRRELGLGTDPLGSMAEVCDQAGQFTAVLALPEGADGASLVDGDVAVAVVSEGLSPGRQRSTAAHELGHLVLGDEYSSDLGVHTSRQDREKVIDAFGAEFLLPKQRAREAVARKGQDEVRRNLVEVAATYRVSWRLAVQQATPDGGGGAEFWQRMKERTPTDAEFRDSLGWKPQPDFSRICVPPRYASAVMRALERDLITRDRARQMWRGQASPDELDEE